MDNILKYFFLFFLENRIWHFMQIVSIGDNLHEVLDPIFYEKYKKISFFRLQFAYSMVYSCMSTL